MGNIFQCCHALWSFFKYQDDPTEGDAEQSPLLSSEESDLDNLIFSCNLQDSIFNPSTGITHPALEPDNFLFPDIILSSHRGGEVTLVEPMVCLLVSEEDEEHTLRVRSGNEGEIRSHNEIRGRAFFEVETQTEVETQFSIEVQTQTDYEAHIKTQTGLQQTQKQVYLPPEAETSQLNITQKVGPLSINTESSAESDPSGKDGENNKPEMFIELPTSKKQKSLIEQSVNPQQGLATEDGYQWSAANAPSWTEQYQALIHPSDNGENKTIKRTEQRIGTMDKNVCAEHQNNSRHNCLSSVRSREDFQEKSEQWDEDLGEKEPLPIHTADLVDQSTFDQAFMHEQENVMPIWTEQEEEQEKAEVQPEKKILFLGAPIFKAPSKTTEDLKLSDERKAKLCPGDLIEHRADCFTIRIQPPGRETFELQVPGQMLVSELHHLLMDHENICHHTSFSLQLGNTILESQTKLCSIEGIQDGALIRVVEGN